MYGIMECKCCNCDETYHKHTFSIDYGTCKKFEEKGIYAPKNTCYTCKTKVYNSDTFCRECGTQINFINFCECTKERSYNYTENGFSKFCEDCGYKYTYNINDDKKRK